jgi:hypothetical protein
MAPPSSWRYLFEQIMTMIKPYPRKWDTTVKIDSVWLPKRNEDFILIETFLGSWFCKIPTSELLDATYLKTEMKSSPSIKQPNLQMLHMVNLL